MSNLDNDWYRVKLGILACIAEAGCWYEIDRANSALFHARLIYESTKRREKESDDDPRECGLEADDD